MLYVAQIQAASLESGCKYDGKDCYDCAQLVRYGCKAAGIDGLNISGANSQWKRGDWDEKGSIASMPEGAVCILYRQDSDGRMGHTGICLGDGTIVHAKGHAYGVVHDQVSAGRWTHYAIPKGMRSEDDGQAAGKNDARPTLRRGSKGILKSIIADSFPNEKGRKPGIQYIIPME